jgi:SulP family sulfate permease
VRFSFRPALADSLKGYNAESLKYDIAAGATVGLVALPLAMAFGIASGVKPEQGLITAVVAGLLISLLGGSRVQIGGPAGAFVALLYGIVDRYGVANLLIATMMAGGLLFAMGALRLGGLIRFVPLPVVIGFTNGIAVIIALQQVRDVLGLDIEKMPAGFFGQIEALWGALHTMNWQPLVLGIVSIALMWIWPKLYRQPKHRWQRALAYIPGTLLVLLLGSAIVTLFDLPLETIGSRFGGLPEGLPAPALPKVDWATLQYLATPALSIAILGAIESLLCARVADSMTRQKHDPNQELMAQGIANVASPLFGGIAATGTIARTVTNIRSGARSPIAGIVHALSLLAVMVVLGPLAEKIPMASLAAILLFVAYNMGEWKQFQQAQRFSPNYRLILWASFLLTVMFDITVAVEWGLMLACLFFIVRISSESKIIPLQGPRRDHALKMVPLLPSDKPVLSFEVFGSMFFGTTAKLEALVESVCENGPREGTVVVLECSRMINLDSSALEPLRELLERLQEVDGRLVLVQLNDQPISILERSGLCADGLMALRAASEP